MLGLRALGALLDRAAGAISSKPTTIAGDSKAGKPAAA
jgi:hypothetical protein